MVSVFAKKGTNRNYLALKETMSTGGAQSVIVKSSEGGLIGSLYLHTVGDTIIIEKGKTDTITLADGKASSVITCFGSKD